MSSKAIDEDIQEAIRLHEIGELEQSTALFGRLADPKGANNPLSQVLYGLALRYVPLASPGASPRRHGDHAASSRQLRAFLAGMHRMVVAMATLSWNCPITKAITN